MLLGTIACRHSATLFFAHPLRLGAGTRRWGVETKTRWPRLPLPSRFMPRWRRACAFHPVSESFTNAGRSEEHTSELQSLMRTSYAVFCLNTQTTYYHHITTPPTTLKPNQR